MQYGTSYYKSTSPNTLKTKYFRLFFFLTVLEVRNNVINTTHTYKCYLYTHTHIYNWHCSLITVNAASTVLVSHMYLSVSPPTVYTFCFNIPHVHFISLNFFLLCIPVCYDILCACVHYLHLLYSHALLCEHSQRRVRPSGPHHVHSQAAVLKLLFRLQERVSIQPDVSLQNIEE